MSLLNSDLFCKISFEKGGRFLGFDVGEKTIGLALSDINRTIATPFQTIHRTQWKKDAEILLKIIKDYKVVGIIIGLPLNMNGSEGPRCQSIRQFAANLLVFMDIPLCLIN